MGGQSLYHGDIPISIPQIQKMAPATTVNFQPADSQQQPTVVSPTTSAFSAVNQLSSIVNQFD